MGGRIPRNVSVGVCGRLHIKRTPLYYGQISRRAFLKSLKDFAGPKAIFEIQSLSSRGEDLTENRCNVSRRSEILLLSFQNELKLNLCWLIACA